jgi:uncharacterized protein (TIGR04255 family)
MAWRAIHEAHAIDRVRVMLQFNEPLNNKHLQRAAAQAVERARDLGFETVERADAGIQTIVLTESLAPPKLPEKNGWVLRRGNLTEEAGFRDLAFGYLSTEYGRWENLEARFWEIFREPVSVAMQGVELAQIKLEYWDRFVFDGKPDAADASLLLAEIDPTVPSKSISGGTLWHSHAGWFESYKGSAVLVNRNFDSIDQVIDGESRRVINIFTLVDLRPISSVTVDEVEDIMKFLHNRSLILFGRSINEKFRQAIGLNLESYVL